MLTVALSMKREVESAEDVFKPHIFRQFDGLEIDRCDVVKVGTENVVGIGGGAGSVFHF